MACIRDLIEDARNREIDLMQQRDAWEFDLRKQIVATAPDCLSTPDHNRAMQMLGDVVQAGFDALLADVRAEIDTLDAMTFTHSERSPAAGSVSH